MTKFDEETEQHMIAHINEDHVDAMRDYCQLNGVTTLNEDPKMLRIDSVGFEMLANGERLRIDFARKCETPKQVREALVALAIKARQSV
ncbi:MAG: DUF2470 domain-containing protein [Gammaproteobacteria bacterium]